MLFTPPFMGSVCSWQPMKNSFFLIRLLLISLITGCSAQKRIQPNLEAGLMRMSVHSQSGGYQRWISPSPLGTENEFLISLDRIHANPKWAPSITLCLFHNNVDYTSWCLRLEVQPPYEVGSVRYLFVEKGNLIPPVTLPGEDYSFCHFRSQLIQINRVNGFMEFRLNGTLVFKSQEAVAHDGFSFSCSSAECTVEATK